MEMKIEMKMVELEKPWKTVNKKKKKKEEDQLMRRPWDALPSLALSNIMRNLNFNHRFGSFPCVCKAWNSVISEDPRCWSSMIPESISPEDAFIKKPDYFFQNDPPSKLYDRKGREVVRDPGVSSLRTFIKKSSSSSTGGGGSSTSSTITSLCLEPFSFSYSNNESMDHDEILHLIAHCCPNLKHISFDGFYCASTEAVLEVFHRCKKIELINFSDSGYADSVQVIEELVNCLPNLRGIRMKRCDGYDAIATHFPWIKLHDEDLRYYQGFFCEECEYDVPRFLLRVHRSRLIPRRHRRLCSSCWFIEEAEEEKAYLELLHREEEEDTTEYSILKEKKEIRRYQQYLVVLRTRMRKKNKKQEASFILKFKMRKKRDTYHYQDFYVRAAAF